MWNSNLPKQNGIYIFGASTLKKVVCFRGEDVLPENERQFLLKVWDQFDLSNWCNEFDKKVQNKEFENKFGFQPYIRKTYTQNAKINKNACLDFFQDKIILDLETKLLDFLKLNEKGCVINV